MQVILILFLFSGVLMANNNELNVLGKPLEECGSFHKTGFYRDGYCRTDDADTGRHIIAAIVNQEFLDYTKSCGNDLQTPNPKYKFPGLKSGDRWCLCVLRWKEAERAGVAPSINLNATHKRALQYIPLELLKKYEEK